jgi:hypothetical protein
LGSLSSCFSPSDDKVMPRTRMPFVIGNRGINRSHPREIAAFSPLDVMLADIAVRIQLSPTHYQKAIGHYRAIHEWLERAGSPLYGLVEEFYTQAGFSIGATVARHGTDDEFDIDVMAQLAFLTDVFDVVLGVLVLGAAAVLGITTQPQ